MVELCVLFKIIHFWLRLSKMLGGNNTNNQVSEDTRRRRKEKKKELKRSLATEHGLVLIPECQILKDLYVRSPIALY